MTSTTRLAIAFLAVVLLAVGALVAAGQYTAAAAAEPTDGTIRHATVDRTVEYTDNTPTSYYATNVSYTYQVDGSEYVGRNVAVGSDFYTTVRWRAAQVASRYAPGESVTVYYSPENPAYTYLERRYDFVPAGLLLAVGLFLLTDALTPWSRVMQYVFRRYGSTDGGGFLEGGSGAQSGSVPSPPEPGAGVPDDPAAMLDESGDDSTDEPPETTPTAPLTGRAATVAWAGCGLAVLTVIGAFLLVSRPPHGTAVLFTAVVSVIAFGRSGYQWLLR